MVVLDFECDLDRGFAWIVVDGRQNEDRWSITCCIEKGQKNKFVKKIVSFQCGHNWGLAGESNEKPFEYWGENRCMKALFAEARKNGFKVI